MRRKFAKHAKQEIDEKAKSRGRVAKFRPEAAAARDEGPRLIPLPEGPGPLPASSRNSGGLPTNRYVALADIALRLWAAGKTQPPEPFSKAETIPSRKPKR
jgi:hypothetical protein